MKFLLAAIAAVVLCGCASNDQGGMSSTSGEEAGSNAQRENMTRNHVSDTLKNPSSNWNTP
jgi:hypothetical protein